MPTRRGVSLALAALSVALTYCGRKAAQSVADPLDSSGTFLLEALVSLPFYAAAMAVLGTAALLLRIVTDADRRTWTPSRYHEKLPRRSRSSR